MLCNKLPQGYIPCIVSAEGDCLYCAISIGLFGSERHKTELRFAAVAHAVVHYAHYLDMVSCLVCKSLEILVFNYPQLGAEIRVKEDAQQFLATVSSEVQFNKHPTEGSVQDILEYTLQVEARATAKIGCYSGTATSIHLTLV